MQNMHVMEHRKTFECLVGNLPDDAFINILSGSFVLFDQLENITSFEIFCHNAESIGELVIK